MKRIKGIISILLILGISIFCYNLYDKDKNDYILESNNEKNINSFAIMLQDDNGEYVEKDMNTWPTDGYIFNSELSRCENGGQLEWDNESKSVILTAAGSDKCYIYFDKENYLN